MIIKFKGTILLSILTLGFIPAGQLSAQTFTHLYNFTPVQSVANNDGAYPMAGLLLAGNTLYGTATDGGASDNGTLFSINTDGTNFTTLFSFPNSSDGANPYAGLILSGNVLYGTARNGGSSGYGTVFSINMNGTGFTILHNFSAPSGPNESNSDGANPVAGLVLSGNTLYGTTPSGGSSGYGTIFSLNIVNTNFAMLHSFANGSDGSSPQAGLILSGGTLYGTTSGGGNFYSGTIFSINTDGSGFANLHSFHGTAYDPAIAVFTNSDGAYPYAGLVLSGNILYGVTEEGGSGGDGTVFSLNIGSLGFATLHSFSPLSTIDGHGNNSDGAYPLAGLILSGNTLYGTTYGGGNSGYGTVFALNTSGSGFVNLYNFTAPSGSFGINSDGAEPNGNLILSGSTLFGTAYEGGSGGDGTIFSLFAPPQLSINISGSNVILTWPASAVGFTLQSTSSLVPPVVWNNVSPAPVIVNGFNTVTNAMSGTQMFYRLIR